MKRPTFATIHMKMALLISERSTCSRLQVGTVIASTDHRYIYAMGYNGGASGQANECASLEPGMCGHIHSEINACINCVTPRTTEKLVYVTHLPCEQCAKCLVNLGGVREVVYLNDYRLKHSLVIFHDAGIRAMRYAEKRVQLTVDDWHEHPEKYRGQPLREVMRDALGFTEDEFDVWSDGGTISETRVKELSL